MPTAVVTFLNKSWDGGYCMSQFACELYESTTREVCQVPWTRLFR